jgi:hypothetical protein
MKLQASRPLKTGGVILTYRVQKPGDREAGT